MIKEKILFWINAIFYIVLGLIMMLKPGLALETIIIVFGIESIISGIAGVVLATQDKEFQDRGMLIGLSVFQILLGVGLVAYPKVGEDIIKIFIILIGIAVVIKGIIVLIDSIRIKKLKIDKWWIEFIIGCCLIILGMFLVMNSLLTILIINSVIGLGMVISGVSMVIWVLQLKKALK